MSLTRHVSRSLHLCSSPHALLTRDSRRASSSLAVPRRTFTCVARGVASLLHSSCETLYVPDLANSTHNDNSALTHVVERSVRSVLPSLRLPVSAHIHGTFSVSQQQQTLYELVKRTRTGGESEDDRRQTTALSQRLFAAILRETNWCEADGHIAAASPTTQTALQNAFTPLLRTAGPTTLPLLIASLWLSSPGSRSTGAVDIRQSVFDAVFSPVSAHALRVQTSRWHPAVPLALAKNALQSLAHAVRVKRNADQALSATTLAELHDVVLRSVPFPVPPVGGGEAEAEVESLRGEMAVLATTALKGAPCRLLCELYAYLESEQLCTVPVMNKFLAGCGWAVSNISGSSCGQTRLCEAEMSLLLRAMHGLVAAAGDDGLEAAQEGLIYGVPALLAAGRSDAVVALYRQLPNLRETPQSVMARVHVGNVRGAVDAVNRLGQSRPEGWVAMSPMALQTLGAVARLIGRAGAADEVGTFYAAAVNFHNVSMLVGQLVEDLLAGLCDRIASLPRHLGALQHVPPRLALELVLPTLRAALRYVGDDLNADVLFGLLESALQVEHMAVPLTTAVVWCLEQSDALSIRSLFQRIDASTAGMPFLQYYALCYARDIGDRGTHDHLAAVWHVNGDAVWLRDAQLATPYKLWKCASCGRLNSDRFNYCLCSSLRHGFVVCAQCSYSQDERVFVCRCCGAALQEGNTYTAVSRKAWTCSACDAANPARQTVACLRCRKLTGPAATAVIHGGGRASMSAAGAMASREAPVPHMPSRFCACGQHTPAEAYANLVGCCVTCGHFATPYAAAHTTVWRCPGCQERHSSLERTCPHCPQVDYLPALVEGTAAACARAPRHCTACGAEVRNLFATHCSACGATEEALEHSTKDAERPATVTPTTAISASADASPHSPPRPFHICPQCLHLEPFAALTDGAVQSATTAAADSGQPTVHCSECGVELVADRGDEHTLMSSDRSCPHCHTMLPAAYTGGVCPHCVAFIAPATTTPWPAPAILSTVTTLLELAAGTSGMATCGGGGDRFEETCAKTVEGLLAWHSSLEETLLQLRCAWLSPPVAATSGSTLPPLPSPPPAPPSSSSSSSPLVHSSLVSTRLALEALPVSELVPIRVDVAKRLSRLLVMLSPFVRTDSHARRCTALLKQLLEMLDRRCGVLSSQFAADETCHECLGNHPPQLCPYEHLNDTPTAWCCEGCGLENTNADVGRYLCQHCLALRPTVQDLFVSECWECERCARANVAFETYCIYCGQGRPATAVSSTSLDRNDANGAALDESVALDAAHRNHIPFLPTKCTDCGLVFLEMRCPLCYPRESSSVHERDANASDDVQAVTSRRALPGSPPHEESGVVCMVRPHFAFIQPFGTTKPEQRVHVGSQILERTHLTVGRTVRFVAEQEANNGRRRAVVLKPQKPNLP